MRGCPSGEPLHVKRPLANGPCVFEGTGCQDCELYTRCHPTGQERRIDVASLISHRLPLEDFERGVRLIEAGVGDVKKVLLVS